MTRWFFLLLVSAVLLTAGCMEEYSPNATVTMTPDPVTPAVTAVAAPTQGPPPAATAYLTGIQCAVGDRSEDAYHCNGNVRIPAGGAHTVQVIARYADNNTFKSGIADMGGSNPVLVPFVLFPDLKYRGQEPKYFVKVDSVVCPVAWSGGTGTAWSNT